MNNLYWRDPGLAHAQILLKHAQQLRYRVKGPDGAMRRSGADCAIK